MLLLSFTVRVSEGFWQIQVQTMSFNCSKQKTKNAYLPSATL